MSLPGIALKTTMGELQLSKFWGKWCKSVWLLTAAWMQFRLCMSLHVFASWHYLVFIPIIPNSTILELTGFLAHFHCFLIVRAWLLSCAHSARCCLWDGHGRLREGGWPGGIPCSQQRFQLWGWKAWRCHQNGWANGGQTQLGQAQAIWPGCLAMPCHARIRKSWRMSRDHGWHQRITGCFVYMCHVQVASI